MAAVRSAVFALLFYPGTLLYVLAVIACSPFGDRTVQAIVRGWSDYHHWLVTNVLGISWRVEGQVPAGAFLIAFKHEAMVETIESLRFAERPVVVMKRELTQIPLFGWVTRRYGVIGVDREAGASALRTMLAEGKKAVAQGRPVAIFPEGTRVPHGHTAATRLCRPLPGARPAGRAGRARQRPAMGSRLRQARRRHPRPRRRSDSSWLETRRHRGARA